MSDLVPTSAMIAAISMRTFLNALTPLPAGTKVSFRSAATPPDTLASIFIYGDNTLLEPVRTIMESKLFRSSSVDPTRGTWHLSYSLSRLDLFQVISLHRAIMQSQQIQDFINGTATALCDYIPEGHADSDAVWMEHFKACLTQKLSTSINKMIEDNKKSVTTVDAAIDGLRLALSDAITLPDFYDVPPHQDYGFLVVGSTDLTLNAPLLSQADSAAR